MGLVSGMGMAFGCVLKRAYQVGYLSVIACVILNIACF